MTRDAAVEIAKKLKALAEKASEEGERSTASKKLQEFCTKHGLDADEYSIETIKATIPFNGDQEKMLLSAVMCMVLEVDGVKGRIEDGKFIFQCTPRQFDDIVDAFRHYKKIYYDYVDGVMTSMITKNQIVNKKPAPTAFKMDDMTDDERSEYETVMREQRAGQEPPKDQSGSIPPSQSSSAPSNDELESRNRKDDRIRRVFCVMEENRWVKKIRTKLFLH